MIHIAPYQKVELMNPIVLAYVGDAVLEMYVRQLVVSRPNLKPNDLHRATTRYVSAKGQALALKGIEPILSEEEANIVRRGRNAKMYSIIDTAPVLKVY
jgi:ribonuclease-3 family protein